MNILTIIGTAPIMVQNNLHHVEIFFTHSSLVFKPSLFFQKKLIHNFLLILNIWILSLGLWTWTLGPHIMTSETIKYILI